MRLTKIGSEIKRFYQRKIRSSWVLADGDTGFQFFQQKEPANVDRNYSYTKNFFRHNRGNIVQLRGNIYETGYAPIIQTAAIAAIQTLFNALNRLVVLCDYEIIVEDGRDHEGRMRDLTGPIVDMLLHETTGDAIALHRSADIGGQIPTANQRGVNFSPVIIVDNDRVPQVNAKLPVGEVIGSGGLAGLAGYIIELEMVIEEYPQDQTTLVREAS